MRDLPYVEGRLADPFSVLPVEITLTFDAVEFDLVCGEVEANLGPAPRPYFLADWTERAILSPALNETYGDGDVTFSKCHVTNMRHLAQQVGFTPAFPWYTRPLRMVANWQRGKRNG